MAERPLNKEDIDYARQNGISISDKTLFDTETGEYFEPEENDMPRSDELPKTNLPSRLGPGLFARQIAGSAIPALVGRGGFAAGSALGALTANPVAPIVGGVAGGVTTAVAAQVGQDKFLDSIAAKNPTGLIGRFQSARRKDIEANPYWSQVAQLGTAPISGGGLLPKRLPGQATSAIAKQVGMVGAGQAGLDVGVQALDDQPYDWKRTALSAIGGALLNRPIGALRNVERRLLPKAIGQRATDLVAPPVQTSAMRQEEIARNLKEMAGNTEPPPIPKMPNVEFLLEGPLSELAKINRPLEKTILDLRKKGVPITPEDIGLLIQKGDVLGHAKLAADIAAERVPQGVESQQQIQERLAKANELNTRDADRRARVEAIEGIGKTPEPSGKSAEQSAEAIQQRPGEVKEVQKDLSDLQNLKKVRTKLWKTIANLDEDSPEYVRHLDTVAGLDATIKDLEITTSNQARQRLVPGKEMTGDTPSTPSDDAPVAPTGPKPPTVVPQRANPVETTVPEKPGTIAEQMNLLRKGSRLAVLVTPGEAMPALGKGEIVTQVPQGNVIHQKELNPNIVKYHADKNTLGELLGYGIASKPASTDATVVVQKGGQEVQAVNTDAANAPNVVAAAKKTAADAGGTVEVTTPQEVIKGRLASDPKEIELQRLRAQKEEMEAELRRNRNLEDAKREMARGAKKPVAAPEAPPVASALSPEQQQSLRSLGYGDDVIGRIKPENAQRLIDGKIKATPLGTPKEPKEPTTVKETPPAVAEAPIAIGTDLTINGEHFTVKSYNANTGMVGIGSPGNKGFGKRMNMKKLQESIASGETKLGKPVTKSLEDQALDIVNKTQSGDAKIRQLLELGKTPAEAMALVKAKHPGYKPSPELANDVPEVKKAQPVKEEGPASESLPAEERSFGLSPKVLAAVKDKTIGKLKPTLQRISEKAGNVGKHVSRKIEQLFIEKKQLEERAQLVWNKITDGLSDKELHTIGQYLNDIDSTGSSKITLSPEHQAVVANARKFYETLGQVQQAEGPHVVVFSAKGGSVTRPKILTKNHWPSRPKQEVMEILKDRTNENAAQYDKLKDDYIKHVMNRLGVGRDEAEKHFKNQLDPSLTDPQGHPNPEFRALRIEEGIGLPDSWRETNFARVMRSYINRASADLAFFKNIEQDPLVARALGLSDDGRGNPIPALPGVPEGIFVNDTDIKAAMTDYTGAWSPRAQSTEKWYHLISAGVLGPWTQVKNTIQNAATLPGELLKPSEYIHIAEGFAKMFTKGATETAIKGGSARAVRNVLPTVAHEVETGISRVAAFLNKATGSDFLARANDVFLDVVGRSVAAARIASKDTAFLDKYAPVNWKSMVASGGQDKVIDYIAARITRQFAGAYGPEDLPPELLRGTASLPGKFFSLSRWTVGRFNRWKTNVYEPAKQGNIKPLLGSLLGAGVGAGVLNELTEVVTGRKPKELTWEEYLNLGGKDTAYTVFSKAATMAYGGLLSDALFSMVQMANKETPRGFTNLAFEAAKDTFERYQQFASAYKAGDTDFMEGLGKISFAWLQDRVQALRLVTQEEEDTGEREEKIAKRLGYMNQTGTTSGSLRNPLSEAGAYRAENDEQLADIFERKLNQGQGITKPKTEIRTAQKAMEGGKVGSYYSFIKDAQGEDAAEAALERDMERTRKKGETFTSAIRRIRDKD